eukprot:s664_g10.t1
MFLCKCIRFWKCKNATNDRPSSCSGESPAPLRLVERGPATSPQRRAGDIAGRKAEASSRDAAPIYRWTGPEELCRQEIQAAVRQVTASWSQEPAGPPEGAESARVFVPPPEAVQAAGHCILSPAPSTVDMRGSLENPSSAPSPLSGGAAWELSDSSHQSLNLSTNSSSQQDVDKSDDSECPFSIDVWHGVASAWRYAWNNLRYSVQQVVAVHEFMYWLGNDAKKWHVGWQEVSGTARALLRSLQLWLVAGEYQTLDESIWVPVVIGGT